MGKEKKLYELQAAMAEHNADACGQGMSREDRKNQHVLKMIQRQEKQLLRKAERKKLQLSGGDRPDYRKERSRDHSGAGLSSQNVVHRPSAGLTTSRTGANQGHHHHQSGKHHRQVQSMKFSQSSKDIPPIAVHFSDNVQQEKNNMYFFRRKKSFEERQRAQFNQLQAYAAYQQQKQERLKDTALPYQQQKTNNNYPQHISLQNQQHQQNQVVGHLQNFQHQQQQYAAAAHQIQNYGAQLRSHQNQGLPVAAVNALVAQRNGYTQNFRTAGTGGMYDPISESPSGNPSSISSASKELSHQGQQILAGQNQTNHPQFRNQGTNQMLTNHFIPRPQQFMLPNKPPMRMLQSGNGQMAVGLMPQNSFAVDPDSSEVDDTSGSLQRQSALSGQNPQLMDIQPQIQGHLLYQNQLIPTNGMQMFKSTSAPCSANSCEGLEQSKPPLQDQSLRDDEEIDEQAINNMLERTREAQRQLHNQVQPKLLNENNQIGGSSSATLPQQNKSSTQ